MASQDSTPSNSQLQDSNPALPPPSASAHQGPHVANPNHPLPPPPIPPPSSSLSEPEIEGQDEKTFQVLQVLQEQTSALRTLAERPTRPETIRIRVPDVFDGSDPTKFSAWKVQCSMYVQANQHLFPDRPSEVLWILSYLRGSAYDWFADQISDGSASEESWFDSARNLFNEVERVFGPQDQVGDAIRAMEALTMKDKATTYTVEFNRYSRRTRWNDSALRHRYYTGLVDRIKNEVSRRDPVSSLEDLQDMVLAIDRRYWERQDEIKAAQAKTPASKSQHAKSGGTSASAPNSASSSKASGSASASSSASASKKPYADKLGANGKLTPEERKRRFDNNLCLVCGGKNHRATECRKAKGTAAGRAASTSAQASVSDAKPATGSAPKKG